MCLLMGLITGNSICTFLQSGFVRICLKSFFIMRGEFGGFCFSCSVILCEQSIPLLGMLYQQYTLNKQPKGNTLVFQFWTLGFRAVLVFPWAFHHHSIPNILFTSPHYLLSEQCTSLVLFFLCFSSRCQSSTSQQFKNSGQIGLLLLDTCLVACYGQRWLLHS